MYTDVKCGTKAKQNNRDETWCKYSIYISRGLKEETGTDVYRQGSEIGRVMIYTRVSFRSYHWFGRMSEVYERNKKQNRE